MIRTTYPLYLAGKAHTPNTDLGVRDKHTSEIVAHVAKADAAMVDRAIGAAHGARGAMMALSSGDRRSILTGIVEGIRDRRDEFADALRVRAKDFPKLAAQLAKYGADALFELWDVNSDGACRSAG